MSNRHGDDWDVIDVLGRTTGDHELPPLCSCFAADHPLRVREGGPRHYGSAIPAVAWVPFHSHNALAFDEVYTEPSPVPLACGHRLPAQRHGRLDDGSRPRPPGWRPPPVCCAMPMRYAPRGWNCRVDGRTWIVPTT